MDDKKSKMWDKTYPMVYCSMNPVERLPQKIEVGGSTL